MQETICIIDIENEQSQYAQCLEFIKAMQGFENIPGEQCDKIGRCAKKLKLQIAEGTRNASPRYLEEISDIKKDLFIQPFTMDLLMNMSVQPLHFHVRVHLRADENKKKLHYGDFVHFQYLALMLIYLESKGYFSSDFKNKITVFIVPFTGNAYPFADKEHKVDYDTYKLVSHYLRLMSKKHNGVIYGVAEEHGQTVVTALDFHKAKEYTNYFPVLYIDQAIYSKLFVEYFSTDSLEKLFALGDRRRYGQAKGRNPLEGLRDICAETALRHIQTILKNVEIENLDSKKLQAEIYKMIAGEQNISLIQFCLFAYMLSVEQLFSKMQFEEAIKSIWSLADNVYQGLRQVVQNSVQYSQLKACMFSFCLHKSEEGEDLERFQDRIRENYPDTIFVNTNRQGIYEALEIFVSDLNEQTDMCDSFILNLDAEKNLLQSQGFQGSLTGHAELLKEQNKIAVRNFFSEFQEEDCKKAWVDFRREDLVVHVGLSLLALTAKKCKASVRVLSSKSGAHADEKNYFYKAYGQEKCSAKKFVQSHIIPGTQVSLLIPVNDWNRNENNGLGKLIRKGRAVEDYAGFKEYLNYVVHMDPIKHKKKSKNKMEYAPIASAEEKNKRVALWSKIWGRHIFSDIKYAEKGNYVFDHNLSLIQNDPYFAEADNVEVCLKGLISALANVSKTSKKMMIAVSDLPAKAVEQFCNIVSLLGVRDFPANLQLCLCEKNAVNMVVLMGRDFTEAVYNSYIISMEYGIIGFKKDDYAMSRDLRNTLLTMPYDEHAEEQEQTIHIFPFDAVLRNSDDKSETLFEKRIKAMAEKPLDQAVAGYKLEETHMRLGSKVHIEAFYEMSFLFYRTVIANRIAFLILRHLAKIPWKDSQKPKKSPAIDLKRDNILFYGYASYSKAILTSITEILRLYRDEEYEYKGRIGYASYQHNLQAESDKIQMYFGIPQNFSGKIDVQNRLNLTEKTYIIQIVPISSTLTTFDKMWLMLRQHIIANNDIEVKLYANYTVFWVVDSEGDILAGKPSDIEKKYWKKTEKRTIHTHFSELKDAGCGCVKFFMRNSVSWQDPLKCKLCYPDKVLEEIPLVEMDVTSTVPSQQLRPPRMNEDDFNQKDAKEWRKKNNERLLQLEDCIFYGHIYRRQNHYQYYIDTQKYFYKVKDNVAKWLNGLEQGVGSATDIPTLHIIFSPEHNTNVGFAQYVNIYYFKGMAEIVSLNVDKEFRSNFICEHSALINNIRELHKGFREGNVPPVQFYFVDDTIISGETFDKANSFLHSLLPVKYKDMYPANLFQKVFLLVDRNSQETKSIYVKNQQKNYLSYVHIDISNVRTQGDSCIGCKLEKNAQRMLKRSSTKTQAAYWEEKINGYQKKSYDDREALKNIDKKKSFSRLLVTHVLQNLFVKSENAFDIGEAYQMLLTVCTWMLDQNLVSEEKRELYGYSELLGNIKGIEGIKVVLKVVCRPFFLYEFKIRKQILTFYIFWAELFLGRDCESVTEGTSKQFLKENNRIKDTCVLVQKFRTELRRSKESEITFLQDYLLEGLTDMGSTYLFRKETLKGIYVYFEKFREKDEFIGEEKKFWKSYAVNIQRLLTNSADETKELWLEHLYLSGQEYKQFPLKEDKTIDLDFKPTFLYEAITGKTDITKQDVPFYQFCHEIFLLNMGVNFDGLEKKSLQLKKVEEESKESRDGNKGKYEYFMEYWTMMRKLDSLMGNNTVSKDYSEELRLFDIIKEKRNEEGNNDIDTWYENLLSAFICMIQEKYGIKREQINIAIITENTDENKYIERIQNLNIVKKEINLCISGKAEAHYNIKSRVIQALEENNNLAFELENNGYTICECKTDNGEQEHYIIISFGNFEKDPKNQIEGDGKKKGGVLLYIGVGEMCDNTVPDKIKKRQILYLKMILRDILTYRYRLLRFLESDFSGGIFSKYTRTANEKDKVSHEKANSHNTTADDEITIEMFTRPDLMKIYKVLDELKMAKWLLLRNYTNGQIAKIFNRIFSEEGEEKKNSSDVGEEIPPLYVGHESLDGVKELFCQKLDTFHKLGITNEEYIDKRFSFLKKVVDIDCEDIADAEFITGENGMYYNLEYFKCIIIDICISAIKFASDRSDYLLRVDDFLYKKELLKRSDSPAIDNAATEGKSIPCQVQISREPSGIRGIDYLVFRNPVDKFSHELDGWKEANRSIQRRLADPLDYIDGHMSLLTIKRYIEDFRKIDGCKCVFQYVESKTDKCRLLFETKLPVLKEKEYGKNSILD